MFTWLYYKPFKRIRICFLSSNLNTCVPWYGETSEMHSVQLGIMCFSCMVASFLFAWLICNQCCLTLHGKNWSSLFPMPKHPLTFFPQTKSSPRSATQASSIVTLRSTEQLQAGHIWAFPGTILAEYDKQITITSMLFPFPPRRLTLSSSDGMTQNDPACFHLLSKTRCLGQ